MLSSNLPVPEGCGFFGQPAGTSKSLSQISIGWYLPFVSGWLMHPRPMIRSLTPLCICTKLLLISGIVGRYASWLPEGARSVHFAFQPFSPPGSLASPQRNLIWLCELISRPFQTDQRISCKVVGRVVLSCVYVPRNKYYIGFVTCEIFRLFTWHVRWKWYMLAWGVQRTATPAFGCSDASEVLQQTTSIMQHNATQETSKNYRRHQQKQPDSASHTDAEGKLLCYP